MSPPILPHLLFFSLLRPWCNLATHELRSFLKLRSRNKDCTGASTARNNTFGLIMGKNGENQPIIKRQINHVADFRKENSVTSTGLKTPVQIR